MFEPQKVPQHLRSDVPQTHLSRRTFLERALAVGIGSSVALPLLNACGGSGPQANITFWNLFTGGDGERMVEMEKTFSQSTPNINLKSVTLSWGEPYYTKIAMAAAGNGAPDVAIMHMSRLPTYAGSGLLEPFDESMLAPLGITSQSFLAPIWQQAHFNGKLYALPLDTHPFVMYYNTDICKKAGLLDAAGNLKPLQGTQALLDAFKRAKQVTGNIGLSLDAQDVNPWRPFLALYTQLGGKVVSPDGKHILLDTNKADQVLSFLRDLTITSKVASPALDSAGSTAVFGSGQAGFFWNGEWELPTFQAQKLPFNMVPFPNVFGGNQTWADSHSFVLPRQSSSDPTRRQATLQFISTMLKNSLTWAKGGHIPAYLPVATSSAYKNLKPQANYASDAQNVVFDPPAWYSGAASELQTQAGAAFQGVLGGQQAPQAGLAQFRTALEHLADIPRPF